MYVSVYQCNYHLSQFPFVVSHPSRRLTLFSSLISPLSLSFPLSLSAIPFSFFPLLLIFPSSLPFPLAPPFPFPPFPLCISPSPYLPFFILPPSLPSPTFFLFPSPPHSLSPLTSFSPRVTCRSVPGALLPRSRVVIMSRRSVTTRYLFASLTFSPVNVTFKRQIGQTLK